MKYWRRHKHELNRSENDEPLPDPPDKKMRYSRDDDILLAKFFLTKPDGTSDRVFQRFGRIVRFVTCFLRSGITNALNSILIIHGRAGRNTIGFTRQRSTT